MVWLGMLFYDTILGYIIEEVFRSDKDINCYANYVIQGTHSNWIFKFPVHSLSDGKFSLCLFT